MGTSGAAYGVRLAAVAANLVERFREDGTPLEPTMVFQCSPLVAQWVDMEPLGSLLQRAVETGEPLRDGLWSEVRPPSIHAPNEVQELARGLGEAWIEAEQTPVACDDFFIGEIGRVVQLFAEAAARGEAVVSLVPPVHEGKEGPVVRVLQENP